MKWVKFQIKTITDAEDIIISTLYDIGFGIILFGPIAQQGERRLWKPEVAGSSPA